MEAIILAAGYATRLYPLTKNLPKPLLEIGNKTIMEYLLDQFQALNRIDNVYIVTNNKFYLVFCNWVDRIRQSNRYPGFNFQIINDGTTDNDSRLGAIGDILYVIQTLKLEQDLLVAAGDNIYQTGFTGMMNLFDEKKTDIFLAHPVQSLEKLQRSGVMELDRDNRIIGFEEKPAQPKSNYVGPALYMYTSSTLHLFAQYIQEGNNPDAPGNFTAWLYKKKPVYAWVMQQTYYDIGTLEAYKKVCRELISSRR
ncbi:MAG TPA: nucleotidyltransferase family protein [bacterium]|nr:nucleotidyltransferase family protein [bacterium]HPN45358.1 nucleotidyltransferase family protein [bacterium]